MVRRGIWMLVTLMHRITGEEKSVWVRSDGSFAHTSFQVRNFLKIPYSWEWFESLG